MVVQGACNNFQRGDMGAGEGEMGIEGDAGNGGSWEEGEVEGSNLPSKELCM